MPFSSTLRIFLVFVALFFVAQNSSACDDSSAVLVSATDNGDGTFTYVFDVCIEFNGLEGSPDAFDFTFSPASTVVQTSPAFTPASVSTSSGDIYTGTANNNILSYATGSTFIAHCCATLCDTYTITVQGAATSVLVNTHDGNSAANCNITVPIPTTPPPCTGPFGFIAN